MRRVIENAPNANGRADAQVPKRRRGNPRKLRVSNLNSTDGQPWTLCGRLAGAWVAELRSCWRAAQERAPHIWAVVAEMHAGVEFLASGMQSKHLLAELAKGQGGEK
jgi:hypothetical protein